MGFKLKAELRMYSVIETKNPQTKFLYLGLNDADFRRWALKLKAELRDMSESIEYKKATKLNS